MELPFARPTESLCTVAARAYNRPASEVWGVALRILELNPHLSLAGGVETYLRRLAGGRRAPRDGRMLGLGGF